MGLPPLPPGITLVVEDCSDPNVNHLPATPLFGFSRSQADSILGLNCSGGVGVHGKTNSGVAVRGDSDSFHGVFGRSNKHDGIHGRSAAPDHAGVAAVNETNGIGLFAQSNGGLAGSFNGDVEVTGDIRLVNQDVAEEFDVDETAGAEPGSVMVFDADGKLRPCYEPYDKKVAGVIAGAGPFKPAIVLGKVPSGHGRVPIALVGKAYCKVDSKYGKVGVGDLLTPSPTLGHAMKVNDPVKGFGAVLGKALCPLDSGRSLIPILIALQ